VRYIRLSTYDLRRGDFKELAAIYEESLPPMYAREPGFVKFGLIDAGHNKYIAMSIWETREDSEKSAWLTVEWVREHMSDRVRLVNNYHGNLALFDGVALPV
jgi:heme-degrading monooxygenase HmoA